MKQGNTVSIKIERLGPDGSGRAVIDGRLVSIKGALPGDTVEVRISRLRRDTARGKLVSVLEQGCARVDPICPHVGICGGCRWQDVPYEQQLKLKQGLLESALAEVTGVSVSDIQPITSSPDVFYYRNKMEYSFDSPPREHGRVFLGLHEAGRFDSVFDVTSCRLQSETANRILEVTRQFIATHEITAYGLKSHVGLLRFLTVREAKYTPDVMVNIVTSGEDFPKEQEFVGTLRCAVPRVSTIIRTMNDSPGNVAIGQASHVLHGPGYICDRIGNYHYRISPDSFFQTNTRQAENLYRAIHDFSGLDGSQHVLDLYCGTGTIGISLAGDAASVTGIEVVEDAVIDARLNAAMNGVENCVFNAGEVERILDEGMGRFDVAVCDPPRPGLHPTAMKRLLKMRIPRIVYVSCNAKVLPVDLSAMIDAGYRIGDIRAFDMSPHTPHLETVVRLDLLEPCG